MGRGCLRLVQLQDENDNEAWQQFVSLYRPVIFRMARKRGLQDADDMAQQILVNINRSIGRWEKRSESIRFRHWLRRVAKNAIINALTRQPKDRAIGGSRGPAVFEDQSEDESQVAREIELEHQREVFFTATTTLKNEVSEDVWQIFQLSVIDQQSIQNVATTVGKSVGAAYAARGRLMKRLKQIVSDLQQHDDQ